MKTQHQGRWAEEQALAYLTSRGLRLIERNYRCRQGEIDLIMADGETIVFVEVRLRRSLSFGGAAASVTPAKQRRLGAAARHYLLNSRDALAPVRFDVVAIEGSASPRWIPNAFDTPPD